MELRAEHDNRLELRIVISIFWKILILVKKERERKQRKIQLLDEIGIGYYPVTLSHGLVLYLLYGSIAPVILTICASNLNYPLPVVSVTLRVERKRCVNTLG